MLDSSTAKHTRSLQVHQPPLDSPSVHVRLAAGIMKAVHNARSKQQRWSFRLAPALHERLKGAVQVCRQELHVFSLCGPTWSCTVAWSA